MIPPTTAAATPDDDWRRRIEREQVAADHLSRVNGALGLQAATLALMLPAGSPTAAQAWQLETRATPHAGTLFEHVGRLSSTQRLPWFETLVSRLRDQPPSTHQDVLDAARRVMDAGGARRAIGQLHWLALRQGLAPASAADARAPAGVDLAQLPPHQLTAIAMYSAFLSRLVPIEAIAMPNGTEASKPTPGGVWYEVVMSPWPPHAALAPCQPLDDDCLDRALRDLQTLAWMQRPVLVRNWVTAAQHHSRRGRLTDCAADALRLSCSLLDSPLPPELARHYAAPSQEIRR